MKNSSNPLPLNAPYFEIGTEWKAAPAPFEYLFKPKRKLALRNDSYPLVVFGGYGSGKTKATLNILLQNIQDARPFVFVEGSGDCRFLDKLHSRASKCYRASSLKSINFEASTDEPKQTFDPINPLIGDLESFNVLFGNVAGKILHDLCLAESRSGTLVDLTIFRSYLDLTELVFMLSQEKYAPAKETLEQYLESTLGGEAGSGETRAAEHAQYMAKALAFVDVLEASQLCSTAPDVDFKNLFQSEKYVCVILPQLCEDPERYRFLAELFTCLISKSAGAFTEFSANPEVIFHMVFDSIFRGSDVLGPFLNRLSNVNTIFTLNGSDPDEHAPGSLVSTICRNARSVLNMKVDGYVHPDTLKISAYHHGLDSKDMSTRDIQRLPPGSCYAWGNLAVMRKKKPYSLFNVALIQLPHQVDDWE